MRILLIIDGLPGGGAEKVILTLAEGFLRQGHSVSLISLRDICHYPLPEGLDYRVIADQCRAPWRKLTELSRRAKQLDQQLTELPAFDLILSNLHKTDRIVARSQVLASQNLWFCLHGMFSTSYLGHRQGFSRWLKQWKIRRTYQQRNIVAVSQAVADDIKSQFALKPANLQVINNPFDQDAILAAASAPCELAGTDYLLHVGRFHPGKRHDRLLKAYAQSGITAPLVLLGQGSPEQTRALKDIAEQLNITKRVIFKGFQSNPYPYIRHAKLLVLSSDSEGFGNVLVEALLCQTPVVSTRCPGGPEEILIQAGLNECLADMNVRSLSEKMATIFTATPAIAAEKLQRYQLTTICQQYLNLKG